MAISKDQKFVRCSECGDDVFEAGGKSNWKMCDKCHRIICPSCYRRELKSSSHCTAHQPWGQWLNSVPSGSDMVFK